MRNKQREADCWGDGSHTLSESGAPLGRQLHRTGAANEWLIKRTFLTELHKGSTQGFGHLTSWMKQPRELTSHRCFVYNRRSSCELGDDISLSIKC